MKTYSETKGKEPFDWRAFLNQETISPEDALAARDRAKSWVTCACGNQCDIIPRDSEGMPYDRILKKVGGDEGFFGAIRQGNWSEAKNLLDMIELRSAYLIENTRDNVKKNLMQSIESAQAIGIDIQALLN